MLAALSWLAHIDLLSAARWLSAWLFGINTTLLGVASWRILRSPGFGLTSGLLALTFAPMVALHQMALSEPLYMCLGLSAFLFILRDLRTPNTVWLLLAGIATGLAFLTRYAGAGLVLAGALSLLLFGRKTRRLALTDAFAYSALSCLPVAAWLLRNHLQSGSASDFLNGKTLNLAATFDTILAGINTGSTWFFPGAVPPALRIAAGGAIVLGVVAVYLYCLSSRRGDSGRDHLPLVGGIFAICNLLVLLATVLVLDGTTPLDDRLLLPLFAPLILLLFWTLQRARQGAVGGLIRLLPSACVLLLLATNVPRSVKSLLRTARFGRGYAAQQWQDSALVAQLRMTPGEIPIYTTLPSAIRFLTKQPVRQLPNTYSPRTERKNENYEREMSSLFRESQNPGIAIVYFKSSVNRWYMPEAELVHALDLTLLSSDDQGSLYLSSRLVSGGRTAAVRSNREIRPE
jgi:4-amino-4-deoxy-L-arabinose transferase-like glycosyltransferase